VNNPDLEKAIRALRAESRKGGAIWAALADDLDRSKRSRVAVNLSAIDRQSGAGDIVAVPGKVLGSGSLTHPVTVAAFSFSDAAREKITAAKGKAVLLTDLLTENIKPSQVKMVK